MTRIHGTAVITLVCAVRYSKALGLLLAMTTGSSPKSGDSDGSEANGVAGSIAATGTPPVVATLVGGGGAEDGTRMVLDAAGAIGRGKATAARDGGGGGGGRCDVDGGDDGVEESNVLSKFDQTLTTIYSNRAAVSLKLKRWQQAADDATHAISIDVNFVSGLC